MIMENRDCVFLGHLPVHCLYMLSAYFGSRENIPSGFLSLAGSSTVYILVIHTVFRKQVFDLTGMIFHEGYFGFFLVSIILQAVLGILLTLTVGIIQKICQKQNTAYCKNPKK